MVRIDVLDRVPEEHPTIDARGLERRVASAIGSGALEGFRFRLARGDEKGFQIEVVLTFLTERTSDSNPANVRRSVGMSMTLKALGKDTPGPATTSIEALHTAEVPRGSMHHPFLEEGVDLAVRRLASALRLASAPAGKVVAALKSQDASDRALAVTVAGDRRLREAVPALCEIVRSDDEETIVLRAVGTLVSIGDRSSVGALIDAARHRPPSELTQILFAVAALGGEEAEAYLFTVKSGHPDAEVRGLAGRALEELARRAGRPTGSD